MKTLTKSKMTLTIILMMFLFSNSLFAQFFNEENTNELTEEKTQEIINSADDAYDELDAETADSTDIYFNSFEAEYVDDNSDSSDVFNLNSEPAEEVEGGEDNYDSEFFIPDTNYIYTSGPSSEGSKKHVHNQKITDKKDKAYSIFGRVYRQPSYAVANPANIGVKSETLWGLTLPGNPLPNVNISLQNSFVNPDLMNTYFNDGRLLSEEELDSFVDLFYENGINLTTNVTLPSLVSLRFPVGYGSAFINTGIVVDQSTTLPGEVLAIPFKGLHFDELIYSENIDLVVGAYLKTNIGYGTNIAIKDYLDLRV
ncbi:MAG: hypothetical protein KAI81_07360, partial [Candidatus Marinimicrobia bacterium]|nr:hypothetical protein [Candidatus Neomarinimicrobiota bacterium]